MCVGPFNLDAFLYFLIPFVLVFLIGLGLLKGKEVTEKRSACLRGLLVGLALALFVSFLEGLQEGTKIRAIASGVVTSLMVSGFFFGRNALFARLIVGSLMRAHGPEITEALKDGLEGIENKGAGNGK